MKKYIPIFVKTALFSGIEQSEILSMLNCLDAKEKHFKKGEYICQAGNTIKDIMILTEGNAHIQIDDYWGNRHIISSISVGEVFGEAFAASESTAISHDIFCVDDCTVIYLDINKVLNTCPSSCKFHSRTIQNLFFDIAAKNRKLVDKLMLTSKHSTHDKLVAFLSEESIKHNSSSFEISFNRQEMADYLCVDRSAMSKELCKMRDAGMIEFNKNKFSLLNTL